MKKVFELTTTEKSFVKYNGNPLAWATQLAKLRADESFTHVSFGIVGQNPSLEVTRQQYLGAIDNRLGTKINFGKTYFVELPKNCFNRQQIIPAQLNTNRYKSETPGVEYEIFRNNNSFAIKRFGKTKTSVLSKLFDTAAQAENYLLTACKGKK